MQTQANTAKMTKRERKAQRVKSLLDAGRQLPMPSRPAKVQLPEKQKKAPRINGGYKALEEIHQGIVKGIDNIAGITEYIGDPAVVQFLDKDMLKLDWSIMLADVKNHFNPKLADLHERRLKLQKAHPRAESNSEAFFELFFDYQALAELYESILCPTQYAIMANVERAVQQASLQAANSTEVAQDTQESVDQEPVEQTQTQLQ